MNNKGVLDYRIIIVLVLILLLLNYSKVNDDKGLVSSQASAGAGATTPTTTNTVATVPKIDWCKYFSNCKDETPLLVPMDDVAVPIQPTTPLIIPKLSSCTDSDGGFNLYVKGHASLVEGGKVTTEAYDSCQFDLTGQRRLLESYCVNGQITQSNGVCPQGYGCWDGICQLFKRCATIVPVQTTDCQQFGGDNCKYTSGLSLTGVRTTPGCASQ